MITGSKVMKMNIYLFLYILTKHRLVKKYYNSTLLRERLVIVNMRPGLPHIHTTFEKIQLCQPLLFVSSTFLQDLNAPKLSNK